MRVARIVLLMAFVLAASGCGAAKQNSASNGASLVPATAPGFVSIDSDLSSDQWQKVDALLKKFPIRSQALGLIRGTMSEAGVDYEKDVKPALGPEVDIVWLDLANGGSNVVVLTKPKDEAKLKALLAKGNPAGSNVVTGKVGDWTVAANTQAQLDRFRSESSDGKLADSALFKDALEDLPGEALVRVYVRGEGLVDALESVPGMPGNPLPMTADQRPEFIAAALTADGEGLKLVGAGRTEAEWKAQIEPFESRFLDDVPADAVAFLTFRGGAEFERQLKELEKNGSYRQGVQELQRMLGVRLDTLLSIFSHEVGLYVRPGSPIPEVTLLVDAPDEQEVLGRVNKAIQALTKAVPAQPCHGSAEEAGVAVTCVDLGGGIQLRTAGFDDKVVLTTGQGAISKLRGDGPRLGDDAGFAGARDAAGMPSKSAGFMWIDLEDGIPMILGLANASGASIPPDIRANLEPLGSFLAWAETDGRTGSFTAFLQID